jgi:hypothetical protein
MIPVSNSKFKNSNGVLLQKELFWETAVTKENALYTLKDRDHLVRDTLYPSLYRLYMEENDPTEYLFAMKYLDGWAHWLLISQSSFFKEYISRWREELELRFRALGLRNIQTMSMSGGREAFQASKYLVDGNYLPKKNTKGRPSKQAIADAAQQIAEEDKQLKDDFARLSTPTFKAA